MALIKISEPNNQSKVNKKNFVVGDFEILPWKNLYFDGVIDNFSLYAELMIGLSISFFNSKK